MTRALVRTGVLVVALVIVALACGSAQGAPSSFAEANRAYSEGRYAWAVSEYEALVEAGVRHEDLFYNLGNAYFRAGLLGPAIYNYERALRLEPDLADARHNLAVARDAVADKVVDRLQKAETPPWWIRVVTFLPVERATIALLILDLLLFGALILLRFLADGFARTALLVATVFLGVGFAGAGVLTVGHIVYLETTEVGVVLPDQLQLREGADEKAAERTPIHAGLKVEIIAREPGWLLVRLANGAEGWVPELSVGVL